MIVGPVFFREATTTPRRARHYVRRAVYVLALLVLICTAWFVLAGEQIIRNVGDMARFGSMLFRVLVPLQLTLIVFFAAFGVASAVAQEKDRRTLILLLMTRLRNNELVLGKLFAALLDTLVMLAAAAPVFVLITLLGGVSLAQVVRALLVTLTTAILVGSLGSLLALWREKTFQTLSLTALLLVMWAGLGEALAAGLLFESVGGVSCETVATAISPFRAIVAASQPRVATMGELGDGVQWYLLFSVAAAALLNAVAIARVRVWNPSREVRPRQDEAAPASIWGADHERSKQAGAVSTDALSTDALSTDALSTDALSTDAVSTDAVSTDAASAAAASAARSNETAEAARAEHVDARRRTASRESRQVWDNPVLWREVCTWAYGRKVLIIRLGYLLLFTMAAFSLHWVLAAAAEGSTATGLAARIPAAAAVLAPFCLVSLVIINALAVNSITNERDGLSLDLLLVTDLTSREFVFGKLLGVLWLTKEMVLLPMVLCAYLWWTDGMTFENLLYLLGGLVVLNLFVTMLGIHFGVNYANSRSAVSVSLGAVFFLFVGVVTCLRIMIAFSESFEVQYAPFLAFIGGGSLGLYVALGIRNPSSAIFWASLLLPIATFFCIVSFLLGDRELSIFLVVTATYGFTTAAMLIPAISEFDIAMGRTKTGGEE